MRAFTAIAGIIGLWGDIAIAQVDSGPKFDVASIKRSAPDAETFMKPSVRLDISRATLKMLTALAYRLQPFQVSGVPIGSAQNTSASTRKRQRVRLKIGSF